MRDVRNYTELVLTLWHTLVLIFFFFFCLFFLFLNQNSDDNIFPICLFFIKIECRIKRENILAICICWLFEFQDKQKFTVFLNPSFTKCQELELYCEAICNFLPQDLLASGQYCCLSSLSPLAK